MMWMCFSFDWQELERQKHTCSVLQHKQEEMKEGIRQRDELIEVEPRTEIDHKFIWRH